MENMDDENQHQQQKSQNMNFAKAMAHNKEAPVTELKSVQLSGLVIVKLTKHCNNCLPTLVTGQLLGLDVGSTLEITDCFPFPSIGADDESAAPEFYQLEMMRCLREVNVDNNTVGWYQSTNFGSFETVELLETFINYHDSIKRCVCIIYDPQRTLSGTLGLRAIKLRESFIELYKNTESLTLDRMKASGCAWHNIFVDIPITIQNSSLIKALMFQINSEENIKKDDVARLSMNVNDSLDQNISYLSECIDDLVAEQRKLSNFHRNFLKQHQQWLQTRRQENLQRRNAGEEPLPEEDPEFLKLMIEPSPIDACLVMHQMKNYCDQVSDISSANIEKLFISEEFQKSKQILD